MTYHLHIIGTNFKSAPLEMVARVQWPSNEQISDFLAQMRAKFQLAEIFFLQTCNRREFYCYAPEAEIGADFHERFIEAISQSTGLTLDPDRFYHHMDEKAALHFFRVASSLDSMVLGETEIMKQIKDQSGAANRHGHVGRRLRALMDTALWASKQVRNQTAITKNVVSMASLAFRKVLGHVSKADTRRVAFVGAGHFITSILPTFAKANQLELFFVNRTLPTQLAEQYGGTAISLQDFLANPTDFDAMVTATGASEPLFDAAWMARFEHRLLLLDAGLPRDIDADVQTLDQVSYYDLESMEAILTSNRAAREAEIPKTVPIFEEGLERLNALWLECDLSGYSREISSHYREAGERALDHLIKDQLDSLSDADAEHLRDWTRNLVNKLTNIPILGLKGVARDFGTPAVDAFTRQVAEKSTLFRV